MDITVQQMIYVDPKNRNKTGSGAQHQQPGIEQPLGRNTRHRVTSIGDEIQKKPEGQSLHKPERTGPARKHGIKKEPEQCGCRWHEEEKYQRVHKNCISEHFSDFKNRE